MFILVPTIQGLIIPLGNANDITHLYIAATIYAEIFTRRKFSPISSPSAKFFFFIFIFFFLSCVNVNDYVEDMAIFTTLAKFIPPNISALAGLGEIFVNRHVCDNNVYTKLSRVCYLAGEFAKSLKEKIEEDSKTVKSDQEKKLWTFTDEELICVQVAGLCHDLGVYNNKL